MVKAQVAISRWTKRANSRNSSSQINMMNSCRSLGRGWMSLRACCRGGLWWPYGVQINPGPHLASLFGKEVSEKALCFHFASFLATYFASFLATCFGHIPENQIESVRLFKNFSDRIFIKTTTRDRMYMFELNSYVFECGFEREIVYAGLFILYMHAHPLRAG